MIGPVRRLWGALATLGLWGLDRAAVFGVTRSRSASDARRVVLVVRMDAIGDFLLWTDAAPELRALYPAADHRLVLVANREWAELVPALGLFDQIVSVNRVGFVRTPWYRFAVLRSIRALDADVCIQPTYSREFLFGDAVVRASQARERIGSAGDLTNQRRSLKRLSDRGYTRLLPASEGALQELERNAEFARALGATGFRAGAPRLAVAFDPPSGFGAPPYYVLFPGAASALRRWPAERFAELAARIHTRTGLRGMVCGGPGDVELGERIVAQASVPIENWAGKTSLAQLLRVLHDARLLVTNETAAAHAAAAVGVPAVTLTGGGHFGRFVPYPESSRAAGPAIVFHRMECYGCSWSCIYPLKPGEPAPCVTGIAVEQAWEQVLERLG